MTVQEVGAPVTTVVNTHADGDHWWGNAAVAQAEIVATDAAIARAKAFDGVACVCHHLAA